MGAETIKNVTFMLKNRFKSVQKMDHMFLFSVLVALVCVPWCRCVCVCRGVGVRVPSLSGELEAELLGCDCRGVLASSTDGEREGLSHTLS